MLLYWLPQVPGVGRVWGIPIAGAVGLIGLAATWWRNPASGQVVDVAGPDDLGLLVLRLSLGFTFLASAVFPEWRTVAWLPVWSTVVLAVLLALGVFVRLSAIAALLGLAATVMRGGGATPLALAAACAVLTLGGGGRYSLMTYILARRHAPRHRARPGARKARQKPTAPPAAEASAPKNESAPPSA